MTPIYTDEEKRQRVQASINYNKKNVRQIMLSLNVKTDADIIEKLDSTGNKQGYIKSLIRKDIQK